MNKYDELVVPVVDRAIELLQEGWCQFSMAEDRNCSVVNGGYTRAHGACRWCAVGSVYAALAELGCAETNEDFNETYRAVGDAWMYANRGVTLDDMVEFNDADERTQEEVVASFQRIKETSDECNA